MAKDHRILLMQLIRFGVIGAAVAGLQVAIYNLLVITLGVSPQVSNAAASAVVLGVAYAAHSRITFRGHGARDGLSRTGSRFAVTHLFGWLLNTAFVWLLVDVMKSPRWVPSLPMMSVTPIALFCLKRYWVFR